MVAGGLGRRDCWGGELWEVERGYRGRRRSWCGSRRRWRGVVGRNEWRMKIGDEVAGQGRSRGLRRMRWVKGRSRLLRRAAKREHER